jgi:hypothetical protein
MLLLLVVVVVVVLWLMAHGADQAAGCVRVRVPIEIDCQLLRHGELRQRPLLSWSFQHNTPRQSELDKTTTKQRNETDHSLQQQFEHVERLFLHLVRAKLLVFQALQLFLSFRFLQLPVE